MTCVAVVPFIRRTENVVTFTSIQRPEFGGPTGFAVATGGCVATTVAGAWVTTGGGCVATTVGSGVPVAIVTGGVAASSAPLQATSAAARPMSPSNRTTTEGRNR